VEWLVDPLLAPGSITEWFSPRGLGKTHVALALAVRLAAGGKRVLLLDRDNSQREVRRRLRAWGAEHLSTLHVMTRHDVPPLTDRDAWKRFPVGDYDFVIIDSLDASTEGVGEQDSAKPSKAVAPMLDIAHRADGPAILVLGNTIKSGLYGRSSGVVEDRADIVYEVRDATNFTPTGKKPWFMELPGAGRVDWADRAARRKQRDRLRLAFVSSKFRVGEEPEPFVLEIDLSAEPWQCREVTAEMEADGVVACEAAAEETAKQEQAATKTLQDEIARRESAGAQPLTKQMATAFLRGLGLKRDAARALIERAREVSWQFEVLPTKGSPVVLRGMNCSPPPKSPEPEPPAPERLQEGLFLRTAPDGDRRNRTPEKPCARGASEEGDGRGGGGACTPSGDRTDRAGNAEPTGTAGKTPPESADPRPVAGEGLHHEGFPRSATDADRGNGQPQNPCERGLSAGADFGGGRERSIPSEEGATALRCPTCGSGDWTPSLDGGPRRCAACGAIPGLEREPGSDDVEDDVEVFE
jgi:hypothetical protein